MYISLQGLQSIQEERVSALLARSEQRWLMKQARDGAARGTSPRRFWMALRHRALGALPSGHRAPSYKPASSVDR